MESASEPDDTGVALATTLTTLGAVWTVFRRCWSPRLLALGLAVAVSARLVVAVAGTGPLAGPTRWDLVAVAIVVALVPFVEWTIHLLVLHTRPRHLGPVLLDPGAGHRQHHLQPASVNWVLLRGVDAVLFQAVNAGLVVVLVGGPLWLLGAGTPTELTGPVLTGVVAAILGLGHYEWSHFLFHTAYRPRSRYYRRLKANHRLHHWRNERHWLGVTTNLGDRVLRTYPASRSAVPLSPTARTLGVDPEVAPAGGPAGDR